ncbi:hypothetical protein ACFQZZ_14935 [Nocardia sp. GCM10030253]|uniref:hypothetical protein n=1 Tax=Nocardia sp. GCM10030253 TaxID=3273404 RepID=UPI003625106E
MNRNTKKPLKGRYEDLEVQYQDQIIIGLRGSGATYREIARTLGVTARTVENCLGEISALHGAGRSLDQISRIVGLPRSTAHEIIGTARPQSTATKTAVLAALSDMHGMQVDVVGWFLGMERNHVYSLLRDLVDAKHVYELQQVQPGEKWAVPTRVTAAKYLGWRPKDWQPKPMFAEHYRAVAQSRVMLVGSDSGLWVSERTLRHRIGKTAGAKRGSEVEVSTGREPMPGRPHAHDGRFLGVVRGRHGWWALEVELSEKNPDYMDIALKGAIRTARDSTDEPMVGVLYLCRTAGVADNVDAASKRLPDKEFGDALELELVIRDFDAEWAKFLTRYAALREAKKAASSNRRRRTLIHLSQEAS